MDKLKLQLDKRKSDNSLRVLKTGDSELIDFSSNDYLGLAKSNELKQFILDTYQQSSHFNGSTGSRLITGNSELIEATEIFLAQLFQSEAALIFSSGYMANLAFFSSVPQRGDTILYDELSHACIKDGCRLSLAKRLSFLHNNLADLERKLKKAKGQVYIACESIYSMDGDMAPLESLSLLAEKYSARLIVDEAHSTGSWGENGSGLVNELKLTEKIFATIYTFGKAMGIHGACIACSAMLRDYLINFSRPFIYTTAPSAFEVISIRAAFLFLVKHPSLSLNLQSKSALFNSNLPQHSSPSAIKSVQIGGNNNTRKTATILQNEGFDVRPILSPTVKEGTERLRICLHSFNTEEEIALLCDRLKELA